ncbi:MAG: HlyC/CorC family transporter [Bacilli bacterium]|nr:HlyC/CorC family transporter [Bacilli bacterium]
MRIAIVISLFVLIILSAFFSGSEMVYAKVNQIKLKKEADKGSLNAKKALDLASNYSSFISTILIGNNLVNIASSSIATILCIDIWGEEVGSTVATIALTIIILIFGEILPKTILPKYNYSLSKLFVPFIKFFKIILFPFVWAVTKIVSFIEPIWVPKEEEPTATDEELISMVEEIEDEGYIDEDTSDLIISAIDFGDTEVFEIMKPRVDVFAFNINDNINELIQDEKIFYYSRVPVYEDTIDDIIGVVNTKDILKMMLQNKEIDIKSLLTEPLYTHKTKPVKQLLREFKETHTHIAIVMDEFGGTLGIVTMEDIVEELVGEIWDETDTVEEDITKKGENSYIVNGDMNIYDMFDMFEYDYKDFDSEYETVGGWCTEVLNKFPEVNDEFTYDIFKVTILEMDDVRVEKAKVEIVKKDEED